MFYQEKQNFRKPLVWMLVSVSILPVLGIMLYGCYIQLIAGKLWGNNPMSDTALLLITLIVFIVSLAIFWMIFSAELELQLKDKSVQYNFYPFLGKKVIHFHEIQSWEIKVIRPLIEYGGYGWRITPKTKAYIISGKNAVILKPKQGKQIAIDTINPEGLQLALEKEWHPIREY